MKNIKHRTAWFSNKEVDQWIIKLEIVPGKNKFHFMKARDNGERYE